MHSFIYQFHRYSIDLSEFSAMDEANNQNGLVLWSSSGSRRKNVVPVFYSSFQSLLVLLLLIEICKCDEQKPCVGSNRLTTGYVYYRFE